MEDNLKDFVDEKEGTKPEDVDKKQEEEKPTQDDKSEAEENPEEEKKYSDKDIDEIINKKFAKWQKQKEEEISEAKKLADMSAEEKLEHERKKLEDELNTLKAEKLHTDMKDSARSILAKEGLTVDDGLLTTLITDEAESTKANVDNFVKLFNTEVEKSVNEKLKGKTPKTMNSSSKPDDVWTQISKRYKK